MTSARKIFIQTGRAGDILNSLPLAERAYQLDGERPLFMVAKEYAGLLDGVSYVEPVIFDGPFENVMGALYKARQLTSNIILPQIYGDVCRNPETCTSFARESWVQANADVPWGSLPLTIDRRSREREQYLQAMTFGFTSSKKCVLVALDGTSSPFPYRHYVMKALQDELGDNCLLVDLSAVRAERFYDLLGLFDHAHCLVTVDTGHLHLAHASNVPVVSFITRDPSGWHGSPWRPNHVGRFYYDEFPKCMDKVINAVLFARIAERRPKIIHTWADWRVWSEGDEASKRAQIAQASWQTEYATGYWHPAEMTADMARRSGKDIGDPHSVAYVHDVIQNGLQHAKKDTDIICVSNADIGFTPGLTGLISEKVERFGAAHSHRRDFKNIVAPFTTESMVRRGEWYPGTDLFAFSVGWWKHHADEYGDYLFGREGWDEALRQLVKYWGGAAMECATWHHWHESMWSGVGRWTMAGNVHNTRLRQEWFARTGFKPEDFRYFRVTEEGHLHPPPYPNEPGRAP